MADSLFGRDSVLDVLTSWVVRDRDDSHGPRLILQPESSSPQTRKANMTITSGDGRQRDFLIVRKVRPRSNPMANG